MRPLAQMFKKHVRWTFFGKTGTIDCLCQYVDGSIEAFVIERKNFDDFSARSRNHPMESNLDAIGALYFLATNGCREG